MTPSILTARALPAPPSRGDRRAGRSLRPASSRSASTSCSRRRDAQSVFYVVIGCASRRRDLRRTRRNLPRGRPPRRGTSSRWGSSARSRATRSSPIYEIDLNREPPSPSVADAFYLGGVPPARGRRSCSSCASSAVRRAVSRSSTRPSSSAASRSCSGCSSSTRTTISTSGRRARGSSRWRIRRWTSCCSSALAQLLVGPGGRTARVPAPARERRALGRRRRDLRPRLDTYAGGDVDRRALARLVRGLGARRRSSRRWRASRSPTAGRLPRLTRRGSSCSPPRLLAAPAIADRRGRGAPPRPRLRARGRRRGARARSSCFRLAGLVRAVERARHVRAARPPRGRAGAAAAGLPERAARRARPAEGRVRLERLARAADAADVDLGLRRADARGEPDEDTRSISGSSTATPSGCSRSSPTCSSRRGCRTAARAREGGGRPRPARRAGSRVGTAARRRPGRADVPTSSRSPLVVGEAARLAQLLDNLVSNAIKFTPAGGQRRRSVSPRDGARLHRGVGHRHRHPRGRARRLFERFFRSQTALERQIQGTGLGLYISKAIVEAHGGRIGCRASEGEGTTFVVELRSRMSDRPLVLCADDDEDILSLVSLRLERAGFEVVQAHDGEAALELARAPAAGPRRARRDDAAGAPGYEVLARAARRRRAERPKGDPPVGARPGVGRRARHRGRRGRVPREAVQGGRPRRRRSQRAARSLRLENLARR